MSKSVIYEVLDNHVASIRFNRPQAMNALNLELAEEFLAATDLASLDDSVRAVIISGEGPLFMAGGDLKYFHSQLETMPLGVKQMVRTVNSASLNIQRMAKPVIASVHGSVAGIGLSFMLACDLVLAAEGTKFTLAYNQIGTSPDGGASYLLTRHIGVKRAMAMAFMSEVIDTQEALALGLINQEVVIDALPAQTIALATQLAQGPTHAFAKTKQLFNQANLALIEAQMEAEAEGFASCTGTEDFAEGISAFLEKRKADFTGC